MTTFKPAHKVVGDANKPGQLSFDRHPYLKSPNCEQDKPEGSETTLAHYIARKQRDDAFASVAKDNKLSFREWVITHYFSSWEQKPTWEAVKYAIGDNTLQYMTDTWKAAQKNV